MIKVEKFIHYALVMDNDFKKYAGQARRITPRIKEITAITRRM